MTGPKPLHPLMQVQLQAILTGDPSKLNETEFRRARDYLNKPIVLLNAWRIESEYEDSACVLVGTSTDEELLIIRGNAGRQALYYADKGILPTIRVLQSIEVNGHNLYYWDKDNEAVTTH